MTPPLALAPDTAAVLARVRGIDEILTDLQAEVGAPGLETCARLVGDLDRIERRVAALRLRVVARSETTAVAIGAGFSGTEAWLARQTRTTPATAAREVRLAGALEESCPTTLDALAGGALSPAHAVVVTDAMNRLPANLSATQRQQVETDLVAKAERFDPAQLRRMARRALEVAEPDPDVVDSHEDTLLTEDEAAEHALCRLTLHDNDDGTVSGHFTVPTLAGAILRKVTDAMIAPRRARGRLLGPDAPGADWAARRGAAFVELLEHLPTDRLHGKVAATVVVQLRHEVLLGSLRAVGLLDTGDAISAGAARRLACQSGLVPVVLGGASQPLDLGRSQRLFTEAQHTALATRHTTCAAEGCERPFAWCGLHHRRPWSEGGRTDLRDAVPLCHLHHRRIHDPSHHHEEGPDGIAFRLSAGTPTVAGSPPPGRMRT